MLLITTVNMNVLLRLWSLAFACGRDAVMRSTETDLLNGIDYERKLYAICMATDDNREGLAAYAEKRVPDYKGR